MLKSKLITLAEIIIGTTLISIGILGTFTTLFVPNAIMSVSGFFIFADGLDKIDRKI